MPLAPGQSVLAAAIRFARGDSELVEDLGRRGTEPETGNPDHLAVEANVLGHRSGTPASIATRRRQYRRQDRVAVFGRLGVQTCSKLRHRNHAGARANSLAAAMASCSSLPADSKIVCKGAVS